MPFEPGADASVSDLRQAAGRKAACLNSHVLGYGELAGVGGCRHTSPRPASHAELSAGSHSRRSERAGDLVAFNTDLIGSYGFCADLSRTWLCGGGGAPSNEQAELFAISSEQIGHNSGLIRPGVSFRDLVEGSKVPPPDCFPARYGVLYHGSGWPTLKRKTPASDA